ncbi:hypothetical protein ACFL96_14920, partial [Thermoproteota archaeon]
AQEEEQVIRGYRGSMGVSYLLEEMGFMQESVLEMAKMENNIEEVIEKGVVEENNYREEGIRKTLLRPADMTLSMLEIQHKGELTQEQKQQWFLTNLEFYSAMKDLNIYMNLKKDIFRRRFRDQGLTFGNLKRTVSSVLSMELFLRMMTTKNVPKNFPVNIPVDMWKLERKMETWNPDGPLGKESDDTVMPYINELGMLMILESLSAQARQYAFLLGTVTYAVVKTGERDGFKDWLRGFVDPFPKYFEMYADSSVYEPPANIAVDLCREYVDSVIDIYATHLGKEEKLENTLFPSLMDVASKQSFLKKYWSFRFNAPDKAKLDLDEAVQRFEEMDWTGPRRENDE